MQFKLFQNCSSLKIMFCISVLKCIFRLVFKVNLVENVRVIKCPEIKTLCNS